MIKGTLASRPECSVGSRAKACLDSHDRVQNLRNACRSNTSFVTESYLRFHVDSASCDSKGAKLYLLVIE